METESSLRNVFNTETGRWIISKRSIIVLMNHRHKLLDPTLVYWLQALIHITEAPVSIHDNDDSLGTLFRTKSSTLFVGIRFRHSFVSFHFNVWTNYSNLWNVVPRLCHCIYMWSLSRKVFQFTFSNGLLFLKKYASTLTVGYRQKEKQWINSTVLLSPLCLPPWRKVLLGKSFN
jgi:hypothetical protein